LLNVKCFIGEKELKQIELKYITVNNNLINKIINEVNYRNDFSEEKLTNE